MTEEGPCIYLLDGEDEYAINEAVDKICARLGDANISGMNTTRLDGRSCTLAQLQDAAATVPFLAPKRLVILTNPTAGFSEKDQQAAFIHFLAADKPTAKLVLVEYHTLTREGDRRNNKVNWLEKWATSEAQAERVFIRHHPQVSGGMLVRWIQDHARSQGGQLSPQAAVALANQVGDDTRLAAQEVTKLLTYVNFSRAVEADDVDHLTPLTAKVGDFDLVNALRERNGRKAQALLQRSLQEEDPVRILQSIVTQVRNLLIAREILAEHGTVNDFPAALKITYYPARLALESAPRFSNEFLELIYRRLLELDRAIKTGQVEAEVALDQLVIELTG